MLVGDDLPELEKGKLIGDVAPRFLVYVETSWLLKEVNSLFEIKFFCAHHFLLQMQHLVVNFKPHSNADSKVKVCDRFAQLMYSIGNVLVLMVLRIQEWQLINSISFRGELLTQMGDEGGGLQSLEDPSFALN